MRALLFLLSVVLTSNLSTAQSNYPNTEIWIADIKQKGELFLINKESKISQTVGYNNQPSFSPDGSTIYYSSVQDNIQSDIYAYDVRKKSNLLHCASPESEFSPVLRANNKLSVVRIEKDSTQRIWIYQDGSCAPTAAFNSIDSVGYYCWINDTQAAMFLVTNPASLLLANTNMESKILAQNIGRCIKKIPGRNSISFIEKIEDWIWVLREYNMDTGAIRYLTQTPYHSEDYEWLMDGTLLMGQGGRLYKQKPGQDLEWKLIHDFSKSLSSITRIAMSPDQSKISLAGSPAATPITN